MVRKKTLRVPSDGYPSSDLPTPLTTAYMAAIPTSDHPRNLFRRINCREKELAFLGIIFFSLHLIAHGHGHDHDEGFRANDDDGSSSLSQFCSKEDKNLFISRDHSIVRPSWHPSSSSTSKKYSFDGMMRISCSKEESVIIRDRDGSSSAAAAVASSPGFETGFVDGPLSPQIRISPGSLEWGMIILFSLSEMFLTIVNDHQDEVLIINQPFSSDPQFYAFGLWPLSIKPRESASIGFIFNPRFVGPSSTHLVLQTNRGGFIIHAKGMAVESPYRFKPLLGFQQSPDGTLREFLSLRNPMENGDVQVKEVRARVAVSFMNRSSYAVQVICKRETFLSPEGQKFWFNLGEKSGDYFLGLKPFKKWKISPQSSETLMEISLFASRERNFTGSIYLKFGSSIQGKDDVAVLPLETQARKVGSIGSGSTSLFSDLSLSCNGRGKLTFSLYMRNGEGYPLKLEKISEVNINLKLFEIKSIEGLILYPGTVTQVALIETSSSFSLISDSKICSLIASTNQSLSPQLEFPCRDLINSKLTFGCQRSSAEIEQPHIKERGFEELMIQDWKSQATMKNISVLGQQELIFHVDQSTEHLSRFVKVRNPTRDPVLVQMLLNPETRVDQCNAVDFLGKDLALIGLGFLVAESAVMEAVIQPFGIVDLGPVDFRPLGQCSLRNSAAVRNNLSGVEWVTLRSIIDSPLVNISKGSGSLEELGFKLDQRPSFFCNLFFMEVSLLLMAAAAVAGFFRRRERKSRLPCERSQPEIRDLKLRIREQEAKNDSRSLSLAAKDRSKRRRRKGKNSSAPSSPPSPEISSSMTSKVLPLEEEISPEKKTKARILVHTASFPGGSRTIAPESRAPGSRIRSEEKPNSVAEGKSGGGEEFLYDIWGSNHFSQRLIGRKRTATAEDAGEESQSFFAGDPATLMMMAATPARTF